MMVSADTQLLFLLPPQLQQEPRSCLTRNVPPAQEVRQSIWIITQIQQGGKHDAVHTPGARLTWIAKEFHLDFLLQKFWLHWQQAENVFKDH